MLESKKTLINTSFIELLNERDEAIRKSKKATYNHFWMKVIDDINAKLNRIRINETTLRPAIFVRSSYSTP